MRQIECLRVRSGVTYSEDVKVFLIVDENFSNTVAGRVVHKQSIQSTATKIKMYEFTYFQ